MLPLWNGMGHVVSDLEFEAHIQEPQISPFRPSMRLLTRIGSKSLKSQFRNKNLWLRLSSNLDQERWVVSNLRLVW